MGSTESSLRSKDKQSLPCCQANGRAVRIIPHRMGEYSPLSPRLSAHADTKSCMSEYYISIAADIHPIAGRNSTMLLESNSIPYRNVRDTPALHKKPMGRPLRPVCVLHEYRTTAHRTPFATFCAKPDTPKISYTKAGNTVIVSSIVRMCGQFPLFKRPRTCHSRAKPHEHISPA